MVNLYEAHHLQGVYRPKNFCKAYLPLVSVAHFGSQQDEDISFLGFYLSPSMVKYGAHHLYGEYRANRFA
jgi:hypothetical protein